RRADCLNEGLLLFRSAMESGDAVASKKSAHALEEGFSRYWKVCLNPPDPPGKRSRKELAQYKAELVSVLREDCKAKTVASVGLLDSWKSSLKGASVEPL